MKNVLARLIPVFSLCCSLQATLASDSTGTALPPVSGAASALTAPSRERAFGFDGFTGALILGFADIEIPMAGSRYLYDRTGWDYPGSWGEAGGRLALRMHYRRLEARVGGGGMIKFLHSPGEAAPHYRLTRGNLLRFDELLLRMPLSGSRFVLQAGVIPIKTHPDAVLFGEYLLRQGAYPGFQERDGEKWDSLGSLTTRVEAIRFTAGATAKSGTALRSDFLILLDSSAVSGHRDFSFAAFLDGTLPRGVTWGAGVELLRRFSTMPGSLTSHGSWNGYVKTDSGYVMLDDLPVDTVPRPREDTGYFTRSATLMSLRAGLDFGILLNGEDGPPKGWTDGRVFVEAALLGWENQPIFYTNRLRRLALTLGAYLPTGGWLDALCLQWERHPRHYRLPGESGSALVPNAWSLGALASKNFGTRWSVQGRFLYLPLDEYVDQAEWRKEYLIRMEMRF